MQHWQRANTLNAAMRVGIKVRASVTHNTRDHRQAPGNPRIGPLALLPSLG
jgi:hypothetical protein